MGLEEISGGAIVFYTSLALSPLMVYSFYNIGVEIIYGRGKAESAINKIREEYREKIEQFKNDREFEIAETEAMVNELRKLKLLRLPGADHYKNLWLEQKEDKLRKLKTYPDY